jgi:hypothetical protein
VTAFFTGPPADGNRRMLVEDVRLGGLAFGQGMVETASIRAIASVRQALALLVRQARWKNPTPRKSVRGAVRS